MPQLLTNSDRFVMVAIRQDTGRQKWWCRRCNLNIYSSPAQEKITCTRCNVITPKPLVTDKEMAALARLLICQAPNCDKEFTGRRHALTCGPACRQRLARYRKKS